MPVSQPILPMPVPQGTSTPANAWGSASNKPRRPKTMNEIQQEEARVTARIAKTHQMIQGTRPKSGGWANIAASGGGITGWSSGAVVKPHPPAMLPPAPLLARAKSASVPKKDAKGGKEQNQKAVDDFGANGRMTAQLEIWCKEQMRKLNGSDDLTLVAFCMTLTDPDEIRQYLTAYLGSSPQVNNFASEFINRKGGHKTKQEEWESAGNAKKSRNRKKTQVTTR